MLNKKAVSPLIATIVLISFTIAIGSLVINWGKQFITAQTQSLQHQGVECQKENVEIVSALFNSTSGRLKIIIKNIGDLDFEFKKVNAYYDNGDVETVNCLSNSSNPCTVNKGEVKSFNVSLGSYSGKKIDYIEVISDKCGNPYYNYNVEQ